MESLPLGVFRMLRHLTRLKLDNNRLTRLSEASFDGLTSLVYLSLNLNLIAAVDAPVWYKMPALVTLSLEDNLLVDGRLRIPPRALSRLEELRLNRNQLRQLSYDITSGAPHLRRLYFRSNGVETLPQGVFRATPRLDVVDLSANNISRLTSQAFNGESTFDSFTPTIFCDKPSAKTNSNSMARH